MDIFTRTKLLIGEHGLQKLKNSKVIIFGVGGVGSFCIEALARAGIGHIHVVDDDTVSITNINRQLIATTKTIGQDKVEIIKNRIKDINPETEVFTTKLFYTEETASKIDFSGYDYIVDAIDTISAKILLVERANAAGVPIICSMGTGNKLDPSKFEVADIYKTSVCPIAKAMRYQLKRKGIKKLKVVYSKEQPIKVEPIEKDPNAKSSSEFRDTNAKKIVPGSISFVPPVSGFILASQVVNDILNKK